MLARLWRPRSRTSPARQISASATPGRRQISAITGQERARRHLIVQAEAEARP